MGGAVPVGCGQCLPCRINRRRIWAARQYLESLCHDENCFVTLTYNDEHVPPSGSLVPRDYQLFLKKFRHHLDKEGIRLRYVLCGEYGERSLRPHYHASFFGVGGWCSELVDKAWGHGFVQVAEFNQATAQYVAGYVVKKLSNADDGRLAGRYNEFGRQSNRPGIGAPAMEVIANQLHSLVGLKELERLGDVPIALQMGRKKLPLGRYLRGKLRDEIGMPEEWRARVKQKWVDEAQEKLLPLLKAEIDSGALGSVAQITVSVNLGKIRSVESRANVFRQRGSL